MYVHLILAPKNTAYKGLGDGLRHFAYQKEAKFYNGVTLDDIHGPNKTNVNGISAWAEKGIVGRGILLDYHEWRQANNVPHDPFKSVSIPLKHLKAVLESQGTELKFGDILIIRSGYMHSYNQKSKQEIAELAKAQPPAFAGVEQSEEMLQWIWENFAAVAGDHPGFECWPSQRDFLLHEVLLAGWGCPIGELFDLEKLAEECKKAGRWSFFVTSEVCNVRSPGRGIQLTSLEIADIAIDRFLAELLHLQTSWLYSKAPDNDLGGRGLWSEKRREVYSSWSRRR
jgi:hypothetical protein